MGSGYELNQNPPEKGAALSFNGAHEVQLSRDALWASLNDPAVLQACIRGCESVEKIDSHSFSALFRLRVGPVKKSFTATLNIIDDDAPESYRLQSAMSAGIAGNIAGSADVELTERSENCTLLNYRATVNASGWLGGLGIRVLGGTAENYMKKFFETLISILESRAASGKFPGEKFGITER